MPSIGRKGPTRAGTEKTRDRPSAYGIALAPLQLVEELLRLRLAREGGTRTQQLFEYGARVVWTSRALQRDGDMVLDFRVPRQRCAGRLEVRQRRLHLALLDHEPSPAYP